MTYSWKSECDFGLNDRQKIDQSMEELAMTDGTML